MTLETISLSDYGFRTLAPCPSHAFVNAKQREREKISIKLFIYTTSNAIAIMNAIGAKDKAYPVLVPCLQIGANLLATDRSGSLSFRLM